MHADLIFITTTVFNSFDIKKSLSELIIVCCPFTGRLIFLLLSFFYIKRYSGFFLFKIMNRI